MNVFFGVFVLIHGLDLLHKLLSTSTQQTLQDYVVLLSLFASPGLNTKKVESY